MKTKVTNTINGEVSTFETKELANEFVKSEIHWFNSPGENERNDGYNADDFIIEVVKWVICDKTDNSNKPYISEDYSNTGDIDSAKEYDSQELAEQAIINNEWSEWAYVMEK